MYVRMVQSACYLLTPELQVVNALLTQLDKLKHRKNVLVMSTSNLAKAIGSLDKFLLSTKDVMFLPLTRLCVRGPSRHRPVHRSSAPRSYLRNSPDMPRRIDYKRHSCAYCTSCIRGTRLPWSIDACLISAPYLRTFQTLLKRTCIPRPLDISIRTPLQLTPENGPT